MSLKELAGSDAIAETEKEKSAKLAEMLSEKKFRWEGDKLMPWPEGEKFARPAAPEFTPQTAGLALANDQVVLKGGPFDGSEVRVNRGLQVYERPTADATGLSHFVPARYRRTAKRSEDGLTIYQYQELQPAAV
jgi:hypothetical protein